ncbi:KilA-N domain-containing protein [Flavobacterium phragmitis]|uniref:KilA-N domain-containing protein n=1 Tax=Flavobacterium phragmitis TaxID=739143 RepID=A0A1I1RWT4_9FLAO|nr:KilA-N domain-containing protein [Flavobacterium phragmitis]SFD38725.1 KilA-N domain-containing protein [Flavobacterium phragmitis]
MAKGRILQVKESTITVITQNEIDYISLTDMTAHFKEGSGLIGKWITNKNTLEYLGVWENIKNPNFNYPEFGVINQEAGTNRFIMSAGQWIERTKAIGLIVKAGRYGGTYAHKDVAFHFAMWLSPEFQIYLINEFQRLKDDENNRLKLEWNLQRTLAKINYHIHTDAIKENLIPKEITKQQENFVYANEADLLNVALFGITAKEWRDKNLGNSRNIRDYATLEQLVVLSNAESINALLIRQGLTQSERLIQLNKVAITQMKSLLECNEIKKLK